jgi:uncharacterized protein
VIAFMAGASSGLGEAFPRPAGDGWNLVITARRGGRLSALAGRLAAQHGVSVQTCAADMTDPRDVGNLERVVAAEPDLPGPAPGLQPVASPGQMGSM